MRGYLEYCGVIMSTMGVIEYRGGVQYCGGYHGYHGGCSVPWGEIFCYLSTPWY